MVTVEILGRGPLLYQYLAEGDTEVEAQVYQAYLILISYVLVAEFKVTSLNNTCGIVCGSHTAPVISWELWQGMIQHHSGVQ